MREETFTQTQIQRNIIELRGKKLRSGWRSLLAVLAYAAEDPEPELCDHAFEVLSLAVKDYSSRDGELTNHHFDALVQCTAAADKSWKPSSAPGHTALSMRSKLTGSADDHEGAVLVFLVQMS